MSPRVPPPEGGAGAGGPGAGPGAGPGQGAWAAGPAPELRATYRLQLTPDFGFGAARALVPYLRDLGISHLYLSPSLQAREGSTHGYDVTDPSRLSGALGGDAGFRELAADVRGAGMGIVLDVVPNHMGTGDENRYWADPELRERFFDLDPVSGRWRRFFDIDDLAGIRIERPEVFEATHALVLSLVRDGLVDGLRVDHPDGLADPLGYLRRLREGGAGRVWVEKILAPSERLPGDWPVSGSVGYEFLNDACGLFVDPAAEDRLTGLWERVSGDPRPFGSYALEAKLEQAHGPFTPEIERLARIPGAPSAEALALALCTLPVYRTYDPPSAGELVTRFQQTSPAIMAKGVEDTAFYRYGRLLALNDVGGDPGRFGVELGDFHARAAERAVRYPEALLTTMTHDAKRSTDVRARIAALTQIPDEWAEHVERWMALSERHRTRMSSGAQAPDDVERYFILQTLAGAWPIESERLDGYLEKALREAKRNSNWLEPDEEWEAAVKRFAAALVADQEFMSSFTPLAERLTALAAPSVLGQLALKLTAPGIPDTYQGDELEFRALVDPDNRRPVDWDLRQAWLARLLGGGRLADDLGDHKLTLTARLLGLRTRRPQPFTSSGRAGSYEPLDAGPGACAFVRGGEVLTVVMLPRAGAAEASVLRDPPGGRWREVLTGDERSFDRGVAVERVVSPETGLAVYERL